MSAIDSLLKRLGFVRIAKYGLVLTPEGRIMSLRPTILDDGLGGRIVGWPDGDLAAMELQKWEPARPAPQRAVATRLAATPPPLPRITPPLPKAAVTVAPAAPAPVVAEPPQVEEDDWEWEIALARARVATEEAEQAAALARAPRRRDTVPPPVLEAAKPLVVQIPPKPIDFDDRTKPSIEVARLAAEERRQTQRQPTPIGVRRISIPPKTQPIAVAPPPVPQQARPATSPPTIIPIPKLPSVKHAAAHMQPVVNSAAPQRPSRTRFAKGTGPVSDTHVGVAPPPPIRPAEETQPGILLPAAARAVSLPSIKRSSR